MASATILERDAQQAVGDHKVHPNEIAIGVVIGRASEYFDFFVFGIAACWSSRRCSSPSSTR